ncbi:hypothetical protein [Streptomyces sp. NPDC001450]
MTRTRVANCWPQPGSCCRTSSARRIALGIAGRIPEAPELDAEGRAVEIWY